MHLRFAIILLMLLFASQSYSQLGFCGGSTGDAIFTENFGNGTDYGPELTPGITTYTYVSGAPQDSFYTLFHRTNLLQSWHNSPDHTPDVTDGPNGKCLIVNANNNVSGAFYKRTVTGLCVNTTFEFSAWVLNVFNSNSSACSGNEIPINVRFEIWNDTQTTLLSSGDTGDIFGTTSPIWKQFALVFTTTNQTSVVLIMKNNGVGGCGNDLAIDDISFKSCGALTTVSNPSYPNNNYTTCNTPASVTLNAVTNGSSNYFYQWQSSIDNLIWTDIVGQNNATLIPQPVSVTTYYRTKIAQDIANINSTFCSTVSNVFTVMILNGLPPAVSNGNKNSCSNEPIPTLSVTTNSENSVSWFDQPNGGNLLLSNSSNYIPSAAGTYYAEVYNSNSACFGTTRTAVTLSIDPIPTATFIGKLNYCSGETTEINFQSTEIGTTYSWIANSTNVSGAVNGNGSAIAQNVTTSGSNGTINYTVTPENNGCLGTPINIEITVFAKPEPLIKDGSICILGSGTFGIPPYILHTELSATDYTFEWFFNGNPIANAQDNIYSANQIGQYGVIATNNVSNCASDLITASVTEISKITSISVDQSKDFSENTFITVNVTGGQPPFLYQINNGGYQTSNTFSDLLPGIYEIEVTDSFGCSTLNSTVILINYPKYFTPNGDGYNDTWTVLNMDENAFIRIFDRYGKFIVEINAKNQSWDGTYKGQELPADDYWFTVKYVQNGVFQEFKNHFSLKR